MLKVKSFMANNQAILNDGNRVIFKSYDSIIAVVENDKVSLSNHWDYSRTTMKYLCKFLNHDSISEVRKKIESEEYKIEINTNGDKL